jgi:RNA polymerase sigma factor (sigma-70 family)
METQGTVFVVDDDPGFRRSMRWLLESDGLEVETYQTATEFLGEHDPERPGCLVLDVRMPGVDGLQLQEVLVTDGECLPIIFVTGCGEVPTTVQAMKRGAFDFLEKPIADRRFLGLVHEAIGRDLQRRRMESRQRELRSRIERLTPREREVMDWLLEGKPAKRIAADLGISTKTVLRHRSRVLEKLRVGSEAELIRQFLDHSLELI